MSENHRAGLTKVVIHQSLTRTMLVMGGERTLVILSILISGYLGYLLSMRFNVVIGLVVGGALWLVLLGFLQRMARADPQMWAVVMRAKRYRSFYPARGRFSARNRAFNDFK